MSLELLTQNMIAQFGQKGRAWIGQLPEIVDQIAQKYSIRDLIPYKNLSYYYVLSGFMNDQPVVLKVGLEHRFLEHEAKALQVFQDYGSVKLLYQGDRYLLLEKLMPGDSLAIMMDDDHQDAKVFCDLMNQLHKVSGYEKQAFRTLREWLALFDEQWDLPGGYLEKARQFRDQFCDESNPVVLLHGDLHHDNILSSNNTWKAIDPKGVIGIPMYDVTSFVVNPTRMLQGHDEETLKVLFKRRIQVIAALQQWKEADVAACCFMYTILSWLWSLQDGTEGLYQKRCAAIFDSLL